MPFAGTAMMRTILFWAIIGSKIVMINMLRVQIPPAMHAIIPMAGTMPASLA